jgi:signal transduction histidine kinase
MEPLVMIELHAAAMTIDGSAESRMTAELIARTAARLRRLADTILLDARADEEGISSKPVDLGVVLQHVLDLLAPDTTSRSAHVTAGPMPTVLGDEALLSVLLINLVTNALKYGPREHPTIAIAAERRGAEWRVTVTDNGAPIADTDRRVIFKPFKRGHRERRARGAGLGLSICRRIVERHGGHIGVRSSAAGNCFYFTLAA